jgi:hypothetical protein
MVSYPHKYYYYTTDPGKVKLPSPGLGRDDGQRLRVAYCAACCALLQHAMSAMRW